MNTPSNVRQRISRQTKIKVLILGLVFLAVAIYLIFDTTCNGPLMSLLSNRDKLIATVESYGAFAPLLYIVLQAVQTVVAPIPGQIVGSVGGFLFGAWGILWTFVGTAIGCYIVFKLARRFGRPLVERIFKKSAVEKFDFILDAKGASLILFAIFLLPGFPDDLVCYMAGLTKLSIRRLMLLVMLGHLPSMVLTNYLGAGLGDNLVMVAIVSLATVLVLGIAVWQRERIMKILKKGNSSDQTPPKS